MEGARDLDQQAPSHIDSFHSKLAGRYQRRVRGGLKREGRLKAGQVVVPHFASSRGARESPM